MSYVRCHKDPYAFRIGHLQTGQRAYSRPLCAIATSVAVASTRHPQPLSLSASCSTSIHVQARQGRHDEARKQARLSCCAVVSSWLRCVWRVGALSPRVHHAHPLPHLHANCRHLLAASTTDDRLCVFRPPNNRLMSEWVEVCACCTTELLTIC
jgi:hypothetical protein